MRDKDMFDTPWVIFDLDGTLADITHRLPEIRAGKYFDSMHKIPEDKLKLDIYHLYDTMFCAGFNMAIVTGRDNTFQLLTEQWLSKHDIEYDELHMRPAGNTQSDDEIKNEILIDHFSERDILFVVDDRQKVVDMWRRNGITTLQCQKGDY